MILCCSGAVKDSFETIKNNTVITVVCFIKRKFLYCYSSSDILCTSTYEITAYGSSCPRMR